MSTRPGRTGIDPASVLFGSTRRRVLAWLLGHADEAYYLRQIARHTGVSAGTVQRELEQLTAGGLRRRTVDGRQVYFQAERDAPIFPELQAQFAKTVGIVAVLREALAPLTRRIRVAFVFGSGARGELRAGSDVDVMVVGDVEFRDVVDWERNGWLTRHRASASEIRDLLRVVERDLADSATEGLSPEWRLNIAYNAALQTRARPACSTRSASQCSC